MKRAAWILLGAVMLLAALGAMALAAYLVWGLPQALGHITVNGQAIDLHGAHAGHWLLATLGILLAVTIVLVLVPTLALLAMIVPVTLATVGLALIVLILGLVLSPLWLLIWWLCKRSAKPETMAT